MNRVRVDVAILFALATLACGVVAFTLPAQRSNAVHVYLLVLGALLMVAVVSSVRSAVPRRRPSELVHAMNADRRSDPSREPADLARMEREVTLSVGNAYDLHVRLLPKLRSIAQARLERSGKQPGPDTLGRWWELLRPDRPPPVDRFAAGISANDLRELVRDLDRMGR